MAAAPTIPNQATDELLDGCAALSREYGVGIHTHLAESKVQVVESRRRWGKSIVARLADHRVLGPGFVGAHSIWLDDADLRMLADAGAAVAHNPGSNLRLGAGIAPVREMLDRGLAVGLGTDGSTCADNQNLFEALRIASIISTVRFPHETARWLDADTVWGLVTLGTARVMGQPGDLGALAPGRKADLVLLRTDSIFLRPLADPVKALVYAETGASVDTVLVDGRVVLGRGPRDHGGREQDLRARPGSGRPPPRARRGHLGSGRAPGALRGRGVPGRGHHAAPHQPLRGADSDELTGPSSRSRIRGFSSRGYVCGRSSISR